MSGTDRAAAFLAAHGDTEPASESVPRAREVSYDRMVPNLERPEPHSALFPDPDSEWRAGALPDEPTWPRPPRNTVEALARAEARAAYWRTMMRAPYATGYRRKRRPLRTADFMRRPPVGTLTCSRCGEAFERTGTRGPVPGLCPSCAKLSRNRPGR